MYLILMLWFNTILRLWYVNNLQDNETFIYVNFMMDKNIFIASFTFHYKITNKKLSALLLQHSIPLSRHTNQYFIHIGMKIVQTPPPPPSPPSPKKKKRAIAKAQTFSVPFPSFHNSLYLRSTIEGVHSFLWPTGNNMLGTLGISVVYIWAMHHQ